MQYVTCLAVALSLVLILGATPVGWTANPEVVRQFQERRPTLVYDEAKVRPYALPDALLAADGTRIATPKQWRARRAEILELFRTHMFGRAPGKPEKLSFELLHEDPGAMDGAATLKRVAIRSEHAGRLHQFALSLFLPNARREPVPVFLLINNRPPENIDPTRTTKSPFWPAEEMVARGYGIAAFYNADVAADTAGEFRDGVIRLFEGDLPLADRPPDAWVALAAWAWGASRAMDYFETDPRVDARRVAVVGHSRGGKTALWAAAEDERFAMAVSNNSGSCGAALSRRRYGETIRMTDGNPHWFCDNFSRYNDREDDLPFDQHMLIGLIAPRAVYVASADEDLSADPRGEFLGLAHASDVYALWGHAPINPDEMPPLDVPLLRGPRGYHIRPGKHDLLVSDWMRFADFADALWTSN